MPGAGRVQSKRRCGVVASQRGRSKWRESRMSDKQQMLMPSPLGDILLEIDGTAITVVHFCDEPMTVTNADHPLLLQAKSELEQYFAGERQTFSFPMAQTGT